MTDVGVPPMLAGRNELGLVVGTGGMARVHCGTDTLLGRTVAIKVFRLDADSAQIGRIENESRALAAVQHPGLVSVYDAGTWTRDDGARVPFLVMEYVDGPTLAQCCTDGSLDVEQVVRIGADLAEALAHVHERGIVHRDVKPANILLSAGHTPKLTDFGIARLVDSARHTQTGTLVGTAAYLSPEQVKGREVGPATDIFALGLVLLEAMTGRREYPGNSVETALARLERLPVVPEHLPVPLRRLLARMTAAEPEHRPTAAQVAEALRADMTGELEATAVLTSASGTAERRSQPVVPGRRSDADRHGGSGGRAHELRWRGHIPHHAVAGAGEPAGEGPGRASRRGHAMTPNRRGVVIAAVLAVLISVSGCGEQKPEISSVAAKVLSADVDAVTAAARAGDAAKVQQALRSLRVHVEEQQKAGELSPARASVILAAGARVALDVGIPPPRVVVSPVPVRVPAEQKDKDEEEDEDEDEEDKDEDRDEDEDEDEDD